MCLLLTETSSQQHTDHTYLLEKIQKPAEERKQLTHFIGRAQSHLARGGSSQCLAVTRACASKGGQAFLGCRDQSQCVPGLVGGHRMPRCGLQLWPDQRHQNRSPQKLLRLLRQMAVGHPGEDCLCVTVNANPLLPGTQNHVFPLSTCDS